MEFRLSFIFMNNHLFMFSKLMYGWKQIEIHVYFLVVLELNTFVRKM